MKKRKKKLKVQDILTDASKWTRGAYARNRLGKAVEPFDSSATKHCLIGALMLVESHCGKKYMAVKHDVGNIVHWNDAPGRKFSEVRALIEKLDI